MSLSYVGRTGAPPRTPTRSLYPDPAGIPAAVNTNSPHSTRDDAALAAVRSLGVGAGAGLGQLARQLAADGLIAGRPPRRDRLVRWRRVQWRLRFVVRLRRRAGRGAGGGGGGPRARRPVPVPRVRDPLLAPARLRVHQRRGSGRPVPVARVRDPLGAGRRPGPAANSTVREPRRSETGSIG